MMFRKCLRVAEDEEKEKTFEGQPMKKLHSLHLHYTDHENDKQVSPQDADS